MVKPETAQQFALSLHGANAHPHFDKIAFRAGKKIFATLDIQKRRMMVKLPLNEQSVYCMIDKTVIYPVPGGWGTRGATFIELDLVKASLLKQAVRTAYLYASTINRK